MYRRRDDGEVRREGRVLFRNLCPRLSGGVLRGQRRRVGAVRGPGRARRRGLGCCWRAAHGVISPAVVDARFQPRTVALVARRVVAQRFREPPLQEPEGEDAAGYEQSRDKVRAASSVPGHSCVTCYACIVI